MYIVNRKSMFFAREVTCLLMKFVQVQIKFLKYKIKTIMTENYLIKIGTSNKR